MQLFLFTVPVACTALRPISWDYVFLLRTAFLLNKGASSILDWVAVQDLKVSYHNGCIHIVIDMVSPK